VRVLAGWRCGNEGGSIHRACKLHRSSTFVLTDCKGVMLSGASDLFSLACMLKVLVGWCSGVVMLVPAVLYARDACHRGSHNTASCSLQLHVLTGVWSRST
jgi:hypothetical protein